MSVRRSIGIQQFGETLSQHLSWYLQGVQLLDTAELLLDQLWLHKAKAKELLEAKKYFAYNDPDFKTLNLSKIEPQIQLLLGFSIENFLKGLWIQQNPQNAASIEKLPELFTANSGHDLLTLAKAVGITLSKGELKAMQILSMSSIWRGRYMIPRTKKENGDFWHQNFDVGFISKKYPGDAEWSDEVNSILDKINDLVNA